MADDKRSCGIYAVIEASATAGPALAAALGNRAVEVVLIAPVAGQPFDAPIVRALIDIVHANRRAALIADDTGLARAVRADGVHLGASLATTAEYEQARQLLGQRANIGAAPADTRHEVMVLAEAGVDYVAFGLEPAREDPIEHRADMLGWWAEIFAVPCVAFDIAGPADAADMAALGADFVAIRLPLDAAAAAALVADTAQAIAAALADLEATV